MARFRRNLAFADCLKIPALLGSCAFFLACGALPIRVQSLSSPSRDPELIPTQPETFPQYASERLARMESRDTSAEDADSQRIDDDPFTLYQHGGRDILRLVLRRIRDQATVEINASMNPAPWLKDMTQDQCLDSSLSEIFNLVFPHQDLSLLLGALGWQGLSPRDPILMDPVLPPGATIDDLHRLLLFEAGIKVEGRWIQESQRTMFEVVYKIVHERGEPASWQKDDLKSTKITWVWTHNSPHQWRVQWRVAVAQGLYESFPLEPKEARIEGFQVDLKWIQQGPRSAFEGRFAQPSLAVNFGWQQDDSQKSLHLFWSTSLQTVPQLLSLRQVDSRLCVLPEKDL